MANSGVMVVVDPFVEALIESGEDGCCMGSRGICPGHGGCGVVRVTGTWQDAAAPSSTAIARWWHGAEMWVGG